MSAWIFLPIALRRSSASAGEKPASLLARSPCTAPGRCRSRTCRGRDRLQPRVGKVTALLPVLALRVVRDVAHRPRPVERDEGDQILEVRRLDLAQRLAHARDSNWKTPIASPRGEHRVRLLVVERDRRDVEAGDELDGLVDHVEVAQAEEVHLEQAELLDRGSVELRHDLLVGALLLERHRVHQRLRADHDRGGVDPVLAGQPLERLREVDDLLRDRVGVVTRSQLGCPGFRHSSSVWPGPSGISFAIRSTTPYGISSTRPASRTAARAAIVPKVMICATRSRPYFSRT